MRNVKPNLTDAMSEAPHADFSPADIDRLDTVRYLILAAEREGARMMSAALRQVGLNSAQREVLEVVRQHGPLTLAELGRLLVCEVASPSRLVDGLVRRGLIDRRRGSGDKRVVMLELTPAGERVLEAAFPISGLRTHISARLTAEQIDHLTALLAQIVADTPSGVAVAARFPAMWPTRTASAPGRSSRIRVDGAHRPASPPPKAPTR
jgi:DNA-binding MarR family transcriptional regulator